MNEPLVKDGCKSLQKSICMGRIIHLKHFVENMRCDKQIVMKVSVSDDLIEENNGAYFIMIDRDKACMREISEEQVEEQIDIAELGEKLFSQLRIFVNEIV